MAANRLWAVPVLALLCHAELADLECGDVAAADASTHLLQVTLGSMPQPSPKHYWPHPRGHIGSLSQTQYGVPTARLADLNASLAWKWVHPTNLTSFVWGTLIDEDKNIVIASRQGIYKYSPDGTRLWAREDILGSMMPTLMGKAVFGMTMPMAEMYSLDLRTGATLWERKVALSTGLEGDMMEGHNGVLVAAVDLKKFPPDLSIGTAALRAIGVNASTSEELWSYTPACGIWNIMALFPDQDTTIFMDSCGGLHRLNLYTGSLIWRHEGSSLSWTDGGATLGPDGNVYTCSNRPGYLTANSHTGRLRKYSLHDGSLTWETALANPCMNFPSVSPDGETVVLGDGANVLNPVMKWVHGKSTAEIEDTWALTQKLLRNKTQLRHYGQDDVDASILGFDTHTGKLKWEHAVEPWYGMSFVLDEERAYLWDRGLHPFGHCGPPHWGGITIDQQGKVYAGRSDGKLYIYDPASDSTATFPTGDGAMMSGVTFAPGMMVVPTCSWVYVFRF